MSKENMTIEERVKNSKKKLDDFYRTRFIPVMDVLIGFTNLKVTYSGKDTALMLKEMISLQKYYKVRLNKAKVLGEEINLYYEALESNDGKLDILHLKLATKNMPSIELEIDELIIEMDKMIEDYTSYTTNALK